ncbi:sugar isomerase domain-containing protein [Paenibacillus thermotolerans]|uniref:sugar isomerase domain-containing protein n=1 Tax=Paenibacillus thermotolerans TaxID=3027807 RepID=UPI0023686650|nr:MULTISPECIES: sugar isomerase domain-containing protein [unclassified Paenibacillus]
MLKEQFFSELNGLIRKVCETQTKNIERAAEAIADAMARGRCIHIYDTGHMLDSELINRAGGLTAFRALRVRFEVDDDVRLRPDHPEVDRSLDGYMRYALKASRVQPGDVLIIGSVSGKTVHPVDLALAAKQFGVYVIGMTSVAYSSQLKSDHSSGMRLFEAADLVLDNCAPPMDAMVQVPGAGAAICPASGLAASAIMWAVTAHTVELLQEKNIKPSILKSINNPGSAEHNELCYRQYAETGY